MNESLGKILKKFREQKNLSIEQISEKTRIPKKIIQAIEEDRAEEVSSPFYVRGFVRSYAQFLGAMEKETVKKYFSDTEKKGDSVFVLEGEKVPGDLFLKHKKHVSTVIIVIFSAWLLFFSFLQMKKVAKNISLKYNSYVVKKEETRNKAKEKSLASKETPKVKTKDTKKKEGFELEVSAQLATWIEVISDGELLFRGILERKQKDTWRAKKEIKLQLGNAGGVKMKFNEKDLAFSGRKGEKRTLVITKDGIKK